jgi:sugar-specific transcriptional regulator TrmB
MASTSKVLDEARDLVTRRLAELDEERKRLERALVELGGKAARAGRRRPGRPKGSTSGGSTAKKGRRRKRRGGITASEIAKSMKIKPNYLYRVLSDLEKQKRVKKKGRTYSAA